MILKTISLVLIGAVIGAAILFGVSWGFGLNLLKDNGSSQTSQVQSPEPQATGTVSPSPQSINQRLNQLQTQLFTTGITVSSTVDTVYPNVGFIARDSAGTKMFVEWSQPGLEKDQLVTIKGVVRKVSEIESVSRSAFPQGLRQFIADQEIFIKAQSVSPKEAGQQ